MFTLKQLEFIKAKAGRKEEPWYGAYLKLLSSAQKSLNESYCADEVYDVPGFYIDANGHIENKRHLCSIGMAAYECALVYTISGDEAYGKKANELLLLWCGTNKKVCGYDGPLSMCYLGPSLLYAAEILKLTSYGEHDGIKATEEWVKKVFLPTALSIVDRKNNWGDWAMFACAESYSLLGDKDNLMLTPAVCIGRQTSLRQWQPYTKTKRTEILRRQKGRPFQQDTTQYGATLR